MEKRNLSIQFLAAIALVLIFHSLASGFGISRSLVMRLYPGETGINNHNYQWEDDDDGGANVTVTFVRNDANIASLPGNAEYIEFFLPCLPETIDVPVTVTVPIDANVGDYVVTLHSLACPVSGGMFCMGITNGFHVWVMPPPIITDTASVTVPEGSTAEFHVKLHNQPTSNVLVLVAHYNGDTDISVQSGSNLTFTPSNWDVYQPVTLVAADDTDAKNGTATIRCSATGWVNADVTATEDENDRLYLCVQQNAAGNNDGSSWADAYNYLQDALAASVGGPAEILVAQGTYKPDQGNSVTAGDRNATFELIHDVAIKGGYAGFGEPDPNARDIDTYKTILSGDLDGNDVGDVNRAENSYHVVHGSGLDETTVLDGFTITAGNSNGSSTNNRGGGIYNVSSRVTITNCTFSGNSAAFGGGMYNYHSSPTVTNCTFSGNTNSAGGGIRNWSSSPMLINCTFSGNTRGAIYNFRESSPTLINCTLSGNTGVVGGGMCESNSNSTVVNCILWGNIGGEIYLYTVSSLPTVTYSDVQGGYTGTGNINADPCFVDANGDDDIVGTEDDNLRLLPSSPCIDAGDNTAVPADSEDLDEDLNTTEPIPYDLDGHPRIIDGDCNSTDVVDMGAYEFSHVSLGNFAGGCDVDFADFAVLALSWLTEDGQAGWNPDCDIAIPADGIIDGKDLGIFTDNWLLGR